MKNKTNNKPELLAPAGNLNCALAAFQSGADAVYAGISRFNAREMGENFSWDDMSRLSAYTKKVNKRFYLTLNTLIKEQEIVDFGASVEQIAVLKPDAVIVQDIGVIRFLREYFPELPIHASTQMGIHNSAGVKTAGDMGVERVILERQVTIDELKTICKQPVEIEVFIHGALCCSISGHCLFSSWMGGWSGNRGRCKQPCRRRYHGEENGEKKSGFFFSTRDFYSLDMLDVLSDAGVCSLKIEGRLKKPDYVKSVVTAYRMMLDAPVESRPETLKDARAILAGSFGRKWSHGFSTAEDMQELIQHTSAGVSGRIAGTVEETARNGFEASIIQRLHIGDRIRVQPKSGDEGPSITITKMSRDRESIKTASKGSRAFIHCDKTVQPRSIIYKIGESSAESVKRPADMPLYAPPNEIGLEITTSESGLKVEALMPNGTRLNWSDDEAIESAQNRPLEEQTLIEAFSVTRNEGISASEIKAEIISEGGLFIPAGRLKKIRRAFWEWLEQQDGAIPDESETGNASKWRGRLESDLSEFRKLHKKPAEQLVKIPVVFESAIRGKKLAAELKLPQKRAQVVELAAYSEIKNTKAEIYELILPFFCPESRLEAIEQLIKDAVDHGIRRFRLTSLYQFSIMKRIISQAEGKDEFMLTVSYPLPAANSLAARELMELGASRVQIWLELEKEAIEMAAANWPVQPEIYRRGKPFLLTTRAGLAIDGDITDSRGKEFIVENPPVSDLDFSSAGSPGSLGFVFPADVIIMPHTAGCSDYWELKRVAGRERTTPFNYEFSLI